MKYLIFTNTPAHVHVYKNVVGELEDRGHTVRILARDYTCTKPLLEFYDLPFAIYGRKGATSYSNSKFARELAWQFVKIPAEAKNYDPDVVFGCGAFAALAGTVTNSRTILVRDSAPGSLLPKVASKFADAVLTPEVYDLDLGSNHYTFDGHKECAYLHPENFEADPSVRERLGVGPDEDYVLLRFNSFDAMHDAGAAGFTPAQRRELIERLAEHAKVFVSDEGNTMRFDDIPAEPYEVHPAYIHDALAEASLLVADTGTMVTEAALVGTPAVRYDVFPDEEFGEFAELARRGLIDETTEFDEVLDRSHEVLSDESADEDWEQKRLAYFDGRVNLADLIVDVATNPTDLDRIDSVRRRVPGATPAPL
jgi:predicted glycosyltransferase